VAVNTFENSILNGDRRVYGVEMVVVRLMDWEILPYICSIGCTPSVPMRNIFTVAQPSPRDKKLLSPSSHNAILFIYHSAIYTRGVVGPIGYHWVSLTLFASLAPSLHVGSCNAGPYLDKMVMPRSTPDIHFIAAAWSCRMTIYWAYRDRGIE
jgi:hypothetical protein